MCHKYENNCKTLASIRQPHRAARIDLAAALKTLSKTSQDQANIPILPIDLNRQRKPNKFHIETREILPPRHKYDTFGRAMRQHRWICLLPLQV